MKIAVILPAAGLGKRFATAAGTSAPSVAGIQAGSKIEADLAGQPVFVRAIELFLNRPGVGQILLAVNPDRVDEFIFRHGDKMAFHGVTIVPGGRKERWETVAAALAAVDSSCTHVAIHDAARPLASDALIRSVFAAAEHYAAVIPGLSVSSTLKQVQAEEMPPDALADILGSAGRPFGTVRRVTRTVDRSNLIEVQTPQVFEIGLIRRAYAHLTDGAGITDDAGLVEAMGEPVHVVEGEATNLKITRPPDLKLAHALWQMNKDDAKATAKKKLFDEDD